MIDIASKKMERLHDIAPFAMAVGLRFMQEAGLDPVFSRKIHDLAADVIAAAMFADDPARLRAAFESLPVADQGALRQLLVETSLLQGNDVPRDAVEELDEALTYHWPTSFGFVGAEEAEAALGTEMTDRINSFVATQAEGFWKRDRLAEELDGLPLTDHDMKLLAAYGGVRMSGPMQALATFVGAELLRADLAGGALRLQPLAVAKLEAGLNVRRHRLRPDWPPVSLKGWLIGGALHGRTLPTEAKTLS